MELMRGDGLENLSPEAAFFGSFLWQQRNEHKKKEGGEMNKEIDRVERHRDLTTKSKESASKLLRIRRTSPFTLRGDE